MVLRGRLELGGATAPSVLPWPVVLSAGTSRGLANHADSLGSIGNMPVCVDFLLCRICPG